MPTIADDFLFLLAGDLQPDGGRLYGTIIDDLLASDVDLIFLETGFTSPVNGTLGQTFLSQDQIQLLQDADTDGDGTRHVFGYVNLAITDHYRTYWIDRWTLDETGAPFTVFDPGSNQDVLQLNPDGDVPGWLVNTLGIATGPPEAGSTEETVYGRIVDYSDGKVALPPAGQLVATPERSWWDIVLDQIEILYSSGIRDFFLDDVARYYAADGQIATAADMMDLVNAVAAHLDALDGAADDTVIALNGGGYLRWDAGYAQDGPEVTTFLASVDFIVMENTFWQNPQFLVEVGSNLSGTDTQLLSIEWANTLPQTLSGTWLALLEAITETFGTPTAGHSPQTPDYAPLNGQLPTDVFPPNAVPATHNVVLATGFGATISGTQGDDLIFGTSGNDLIYALGGDDIVFCLGGDDTIIGGDGHDVLFGGAGNDRLEGNSGNDSLFGEADGDHILGGPGNDLLAGGDAPETFDFWTGSFA